jgi:hypothetical protein
MTTLTIIQPEVQTEDQPEGQELSLQDALRLAKKHYELGLGCAKQSVEHVWLMGKALTEAKSKHKLRKEKWGKNEPNWDVVLRGIGISVPSDNRARRLYQAFPNVEQVQGKGIMEAYQEGGISKIPLPNAATSEGSNKSNATRKSVARQAEDDCDCEDDDDVEEYPFVDMVLDTSANMEVLRDRTDPLTPEEVKVVLAEVERIAQNALEIKMRLEKGVESAE